MCQVLCVCFTGINSFTPHSNCATGALHLIEEETGAERLRDVLKVTQLVVVKLGFEPKQPGSTQSSKSLISATHHGSMAKYRLWVCAFSFPSQTWLSPHALCSISGLRWTDPFRNFPECEFS
jgi:hypothetical protein